MALHDRRPVRDTPFPISCVDGLAAVARRGLVAIHGRVLELARPSRRAEVQAAGD